MDLNRLSQEEVADLLLVDSRSIRNFQKEALPIPSHGDGKHRYYIWPEVLAWRDQRRGNATAGSNKPREGLLSESYERARLARAQVDIKEIEAAKLRKEALSIADYEKAMTEMINPARVAFLAIPARLRAIIGTQAAGKVEKEVKRALRFLGEEGKAEV